MPWIGAAIGLVGSAVIGAAGADSAANTQAAGQRQAADTQQGMFNTIVGQEQPFLRSGYGAQYALNDLLGLGSPAPRPAAAGGPAGTDNRPNSMGDPGAVAWRNSQIQKLPGGFMDTLPDGTQFLNTTGANAPELMAAASNFQPVQTNPQAGGAAPQPGSSGTATGPGGNLSSGYLTQTFNPTQAQLDAVPGYQYQLQTGGQAIRNASTPGVGALSGPALKELMSFNQGLAGTNYGNYFNQFQTQQNNIFNRLSSIATMGQNAAANLGTAGTQLGTGIAQAQAGAGASQAAGQVGVANSIGGAAVPLGYLMSGQNSGGTSGTTTPWNSDAAASFFTGGS